MRYYPDLWWYLSQGQPMIVLRLKKKRFYRIFWNTICHSCSQGLWEGFRKHLCICINMKRTADQPFLGLIILRQTFEKGKREEFPGSEQKGNNAKPRLPTGERESLGRCLDSTNQFCAAYSPAVLCRNCPKRILNKSWLLYSTTHACIFTQTCIRE